MKNILPKLFLNRLRESFQNASIKNITIALALLLLASVINAPTSKAAPLRSSNQQMQPLKAVTRVAQTDESIIVDKLTDEASKVSSTNQPELKENITNIVESLNKKKIATPRVIAYALATTERETGNTFKPIEEYGGPQQAIAMGYSGGEMYYGRGYIQITHDYNYREMGEKIGMGEKLVNNPELALQPEVASDILAVFFKERDVAAKAEADFIAAREPINGSDNAESIANEAEKYLQTIEEAKTKNLADNRELLHK
jgi:predicted chitinase